MELIDKVISDIREYYEHSLCRINRTSRTNYKPYDFDRHSGLRIEPGCVIAGRKPLPKDQMLELEAFLEEYPEELEADFYPKNILEWIYSELLDWEEGFYLSNYLQEPRAIESYWLAILCCSKNTGIPCTEIAVVANIHAWCRAMLCVGKDLDDRPLGIADEMDFDLYDALAQYYTHQYLISMTNTKDYDTFVELLTLQPPAYRTHMNWLTTDDLEDYGEHQVNPAAPFDEIGDDGFGYITRSRERVRNIIVNQFRETPSMTLLEFNNQFDRRGQSAAQIINKF